MPRFPAFRLKYSTAPQPARCGVFPRAVIDDLAKLYSFRDDFDLQSALSNVVREYMKRDKGPAMSAEKRKEHRQRLEDIAMQMSLARMTMLELVALQDADLQDAEWIVGANEPSTQAERRMLKKLARRAIQKTKKQSDSQQTNEQSDPRKPKKQNGSVLWARAAFLNSLALIYEKGTGKKPTVTQKYGLRGRGANFILECCKLVGLKPSRGLEDAIRKSVIHHNRHYHYHQR